MTPPCDLVFEIGQIIIAILVVLGGGLAILQGNPHVTEVMGAVGVVLGFFFGRTLTLRQINTISASNQADRK